MGKLTVSTTTGEAAWFMDDERGAISTATQMAKLTPGRMVGVIGIAHDGTAINLSLTYSRDQGILVVDNLA